MKVAVCIKRVPDTASHLKVASGNKAISEDGLKFVMSPYDEFALEEAIKLKEAGSCEEVIAISVGGDKCQETLRTALAVGSDRAIHINTQGSTVDPLATAKILAKTIESEGASLVFSGKQAVDGDFGQTSQMLAELLGWNQALNVKSFELSDPSKIKVSSEVDGGATEIWEIALPAVVAATKGLNQPRYASLKGIMAAKKKQIETKSADDLSLNSDALSSKVSLTEYALPAERSEAKIFKDDPKKAVSEVVRLLREEAKVI